MFFQLRISFVLQVLIIPIFANELNFPCPGEQGIDCAENSLCSNEVGLPICDDEIKGRILSSCSLEETHWSELQSKCVAFAGSKCSEVLSCTDNAFCNNFMNDWTCHCEKGFSRTVDGHCLLAFGSTCKPSYESGVTLTDVCNPDDFLYCHDKDGKCSCIPEFNWDNAGKNCRARVGQKCDLKVTTDASKKVAFCVPSAKCTSGNITSDDGDPSQLREGICQCPSGTQKSEEADACNIATNLGSCFEMVVLLFLEILIIHKLFL